MSADQIIEEIRALPADQQEQVYEFLRAHLQETGKPQIDDRFKKVADEMFTKNAELFRKLAQ